MGKPGSLNTLVWEAIPEVPILCAPTLKLWNSALQDHPVLGGWDSTRLWKLGLGILLLARSRCPEGWGGHSSGAFMCVGREWRVQAEGLRLHLLDEIDAGLQVHAEVDELPLDALLLVLLLLQHEHVVVEELLQLLIGEVDAELLEAVKLQGTGRSGSGRQGSVAQGVGPGLRPAWQQAWLASLWSGQGESAPEDT